MNKQSNTIIQIYLLFYNFIAIGFLLLYEMDGKFIRIPLIWYYVSGHREHLGNCREQNCVSCFESVI